MKKGKFENFIDELKNNPNLKLSIDEKNYLRESFIEKAGFFAGNEKTLKSPYFTKWSTLIFSARSRVVLAGVLIFVLVGAGVVSAAEYSLPGTILYPVKTEVTEKIIRVLNSSTPAAKEKFEVGLVEKRLVEAEKLDSNNDLENTHKEEVKKMVIDQTIRAEKVIKSSIKNTKAINNKQENSKDEIIKYDRKSTEKSEQNNEDSNGDSDQVNEFVSDNTKTSDSNVEKNNESRKQGHEQDRLNKVLEDHKNILNKLNLGSKKKD